MGDVTGLVRSFSRPDGRKASGKHIILFCKCSPYPLPDKTDVQSQLRGNYEQSDFAACSDTQVPYERPLVGMPAYMKCQAAMLQTLAEGAGRAMHANSKKILL